MGSEMCIRDRISPVQSTDGYDAFVAGFVDRYHLKWLGSETNLEISISDVGIILSFEQAGSSNSLENQEVLNGVLDKPAAWQLVGQAIGSESR